MRGGNKRDLPLSIAFWERKKKKKVKNSRCEDWPEAEGTSSDREEGTHKMGWLYKLYNCNITNIRRLHK